MIRLAELRELVAASKRLEEERRRAEAAVAAETRLRQEIETAIRHDKEEIDVVFVKGGYPVFYAACELLSEAGYTYTAHADPGWVPRVVVRLVDPEVIDEKAE